MAVSVVVTSPLVEHALDVDVFNCASGVPDDSMFVLKYTVASKDVACSL